MNRWLAIDVANVNRAAPRAAAAGVNVAVQRERHKKLRFFCSHF